MRLCRNLEPVIRFLERNDPAARTLLNLVTGRAGSRANWVRADDPVNPTVVVARHRWLYLFSPDRRAGLRAVDELPARWQRRFAATPAWLLDAHLRRGGVGWHTRCYMYALSDARHLSARPGHRITPLTEADVPLVVRHWPYGRRADYVSERIRNGLSAGVRADGRLAGWAMTHADGSMGFLHVLDEFRGNGMARSIGAWLARRQLGRGAGAFVYIETRNRASIALTESLGFARVGEYAWYGP